MCLMGSSGWLVCLCVRANRSPIARRARRLQRATLSEGARARGACKSSAASAHATSVRLCNSTRAATAAAAAGYSRLRLMHTIKTKADRDGRDPRSLQWRFLVRVCVCVWFALHAVYQQTTRERRALRRVKVSSATATTQPGGRVFCTCQCTRHTRAYRTHTGGRVQRTHNATHDEARARR